MNTRTGRTPFGILGFLVLFGVLVWMSVEFYLVPGWVKVQHASPLARKEFGLKSLLLLVVLLTILLIGLLASVRISRFFFPKPTTRTRTKVVDAWAEAGRRAGRNDQ